MGSHISNCSGSNQVSIGVDKGGMHVVNHNDDLFSGNKLPIDYGCIEHDYFGGSFLHPHCWGDGYIQCN
jgi:hypothetical protein